MLTRGPELSLKGRALRLLGGREHSRAELERKLALHEQEPGQLARILDELATKGFINEQRVLDSVLHRRAGKLGAQRIRHELQGKGLATEAIAQAMDGLRATELQRAHEVWRKKFQSPPADARGHAQQSRFLAARGFGAEVIRKVLAGAAGEE